MRLCATAADDDAARELPGDRAGIGAAKPGYRVKTNRRDAQKLAELLCAGLLTEVRPPTPKKKRSAICVARAMTRGKDVQRCRHRLGKLLLRRGLHDSGRNWTRAHRQWMAALDWTHGAERVVVEDDLLAIDQVEARLTELDVRLTAIAQAEPYREPVAWLRCFRASTPSRPS